MKKNSKVKFYFFIAFMVCVISILYLKSKSSIDVHTKLPSVKIVENKKTNSSRVLDNLETQQEEIGRTYKARVENYLVNSAVKEDENGTQWRNLNREWLKRLEQFLEQKMESKQQARLLLMKYFSIVEDHRNSTENIFIFKQYELASKEYLNLNRNGNLTKEEKQEVSKRFKKFESKVEELGSRLSEKKKILLKKHYDEILQLLKEYNKEISAQHIHLGYSIGFSI